MSASERERLICRLCLQPFPSRAASFVSPRSPSWHCQIKRVQISDATLSSFLQLQLHTFTAEQNFARGFRPPSQSQLQPFTDMSTGDQRKARKGSTSSSLLSPESPQSGRPSLFSLGRRRSSASNSTGCPISRQGSNQSGIAAMLKQENLGQPDTLRRLSFMGGRSLNPGDHETVTVKVDWEGGAQLQLGHSPLVPGSSHLCGKVIRHNFISLDHSAEEAASEAAKAFETRLQEEYEADWAAMGPEEKHLWRQLHSTSTANEKDRKTDQAIHTAIRHNRTARTVVNEWNKRGSGLEVSILDEGLARELYELDYQSRSSGEGGKASRATFIPNEWPVPDEKELLARLIAKYPDPDKAKATASEMSDSAVADH